VVYPGYYTIKNKNERISDIVARAGGLTKWADADGGSLKRDNAAVLGVDKSQTDTSELSQNRYENFNRLQNAYASTSNNTSDNNTAGKNGNGNNGVAKKDSIVQPRNNYVGIDLVKILHSPRGSEDLILEDGDVLRIPKQQQTVRVNGQVLYPSAIVYANGKTFRGYVLNAGGFAPNALRRGAYIVYPNGTVKGSSKFLFFTSHPKVKPGSEIFVPEKPEAKGNPQEVIGITTGLASLGAILLGIFTLVKK
jgi:protein involved in polysaccharide export with SLBB domain